MTMSMHTTLRLEQEAEKLQAQGVAYAVATIVRTVNATSAKPGDKALIGANGEIIDGWIGGGCARGAVGRAARTAVEIGKPQFVSLKPEEVLADEGHAAGEEVDGIRFARNGCPSKGSMDIFIEPVLPMPRLVVYGDSPVARALLDQAGRFDFRRSVFAPEAKDMPRVEDLLTDAAIEAGPTSTIVVATQGRGDKDALRAAVMTDAGYIAFVGSRKKFGTLRDALIAEGIASARIDRVKAPAGLDIHAITSEEIALSIMAEIVAFRRRPQPPSGREAS